MGLGRNFSCRETITCLSAAELCCRSSDGNDAFAWFIFVCPVLFLVSQLLLWCMERHMAPCSSPCLAGGHMWMVLQQAALLLMCMHCVGVRAALLCWEMQVPVLQEPDDDFFFAVPYAAVIFSATDTGVFMVGFAGYSCWSVVLTSQHGVCIMMHRGQLCAQCTQFPNPPGDGTAVFASVLLQLVPGPHHVLLKGYQHHSKRLLLVMCTVGRQHV